MSTFSTVLLMTRAYLFLTVKFQLPLQRSVVLMITLQHVHTYQHTDSRGYEMFKFDRARGGRVPHDRYDVRLMGGARISGRDQGGAVYVNGQGQYVDLGRHFDKCLGNIDLCQHGMTLSLDLRPRDLRVNQTYLASPTYTLYYENGMLKAKFLGKEVAWSTQTNRLTGDNWQRITLAWHPKKGLSMYLNDEIVDTDVRGRRAMRGDPVSESVYIGRSLDSLHDAAVALVDDLEVWYEDLDQLRATGRYRGNGQRRPCAAFLFKDVRIKLGDVEYCIRKKLSRYYTHMEKYYELRLRSIPE